MKKYWSFFRIRFIHGLQYRAAALSGMVTQFVWGTMEILLFRAFYEASPESFPMEFPALSTYVWLQQAFLALYMTWFWEAELFESITTGNVAYELCRPVRLYNMWFTRGLAVRLSKAVLRCMPILLFAWLLPSPYGIALPGDLTTWFFTLVSMVLGLFFVVAFGMIVYMSVFYTISSQGIKLIVTSLSEFLSGAVIPIPFLPDEIRRLVSILPFASAQNVPFRIFGGGLTGHDMYISLMGQAFWLIVFLIIGRAMERNALKRVVIQGG
ncbi:ABC transporter permease [Clostridium sp. Marseille-P2415]|uniref:ABC transporter permease n=1 Tax=Clostridium sp. Marseille-P2415 TaxID=1805471 RepID=UPI0009888BAA|nr:ABC transporter permease [Clostridium sp. Marseille-P2415]